MARRKKPEDQPDENPDQNAGGDDTFGLPEIEYEPINRDTTPSPDTRGSEPQEPVHSSPSQAEHSEQQPVTNTPMEREEVRQTEYNTNTTYYNEDDDDNSPWPKILGIAALLLIIGAAAWYFGWKKPNDTRARLAEQAREQASLDSARRAQELRDTEQSRIAEENQRRADSIARATPTAGTIETLTERTGRYYVVVASAIDGDLLMDYARKLSQKGVNAKVIAPFGNVKFHRLTVAEGETFAATQQTADQLKAEYSDALWVIKY